MDVASFFIVQSLPAQEQVIMPWEIQDNRAGCNGFAVVKIDDGELEGCHESRQDALAQMAALYASEEKSMKDKARSQGQNSIDDFMNDIRRAFMAQFEKDEAWFPYLVEVFSDHVIAETQNNTFMRVPYTMQDDEFVFADDNEWVQVSTEWTAVEGSEDETMKNVAKSIKALGGNRIGGYAVIWGNESALDLDGEWFDSETEELTGIFKAVGKLPYLYDHALDGTLKSTVVGVVDIMEEDEVGLWYEVQLDRANQYTDAILQLVSNSKLGTSSGTLSGARRVEKSGRISRWPIVEISATPMPADPRQSTEHPVHEAKSLFESIGLKLDSYMAKSDKDTMTEEPEASGTLAASVVDESDDAKRLQIEVELLELEIA